MKGIDWSLPDTLLMRQECYEQHEWTELAVILHLVDLQLSRNVMLTFTRCRLTIMCLSRSQDGGTRSELSKDKL